MKQNLTNTHKLTNYLTVGSKSNNHLLTKYLLKQFL